MATIGWLVVAAGDEELFVACKLGSLQFVKEDKEAFVIEVPLVTPLEVREMEKRILNQAPAADIGWIPDDDRETFARVYRYLPHFSVVEQF